MDFTAGYVLTSLTAFASNLLWREHWQWISRAPGDCLAPKQQYSCNRRPGPRPGSTPWLRSERPHNAGNAPFILVVFSLFSSLHFGNTEEITGYLQLPFRAYIWQLKIWPLKVWTKTRTLPNCTSWKEEKKNPTVTVPHFCAHEWKDETPWVPPALCYSFTALCWHTYPAPQINPPRLSSLVCLVLLYCLCNSLEYRHGIEVRSSAYAKWTVLKASGGSGQVNRHQCCDVFLMAEEQNPGALCGQELADDFPHCTLLWFSNFYSIFLTNTVIKLLQIKVQP